MFDCVLCEVGGLCEWEIVWCCVGVVMCDV